VTVFDRLSALADATRSRLLLVLDRHELTVTELCQALQLPQSTVSRHLRILADEGWVVSRAEGTSRQYRMASPLEAGARRLWQVVREQVGGGAQAVQDAERVRSVVAQRRTQSREFFTSAAGQWDGVRTELFGARAELSALPALLDEDWTIGDLGCGTGQVSAALAPFVRQVVAVDESRAMLAAARRRLDGVSNVDLRQGELERLPIEDGALDAAILFLVLHHVVEPARALAEAERTLKPGGRLLMVDMLPHERDDYRAQMGHVWQGFSPGQLGDWIEEAGLERLRYTALPPDPQARGPILFAATARSRGASGIGRVGRTA